MNVPPAGPSVGRGGRTGTYAPPRQPARPPCEGPRDGFGAGSGPWCPPCRQLGGSGPGGVIMTRAPLVTRRRRDPPRGRYHGGLQQKRTPPNPPCTHAPSALTSHLSTGPCGFPRGRLPVRVVGCGVKCSVQSGAFGSSPPNRAGPRMLPGRGGFEREAGGRALLRCGREFEVGFSHGQGPRAAARARNRPTDRSRETTA